MDCWDFMRCGENTYQRCPAYPNRGRECWKVTGTKCDGGRMEMKNIYEKIEHCRGCGYYIDYAQKY